MITIPQLQLSGPQTQASSLPTPMLPCTPLGALQQSRPESQTKPAPLTWTPDRETIPAVSHSRDTFQLYLREIGQVALLEPEEEVVLAERIKLGDLEAREQMIKANLRLVVK